MYISGNERVLFGTEPGKLTFNGIRASDFELKFEWPLGTDGFYLMKYEISQQQYLDFFNTLSLAQRNAHWNSRSSSESTFALDQDGHRNALTRSSSGFLAFPDDQSRHIACNYLNWADLLTWLDWAGLRPITEFEFEKACRGPLQPLPKEFAWGTQKANNITALSKPGFDDEAPANAVFNSEAGNAVHGALFGQPYLNAPVRQGFAASDSSTRISSGAGFYGAFELSGSLWEMCVKACSEATAFTSKPGDGNISVDGAYNESWPAATSAITRGGGCNSLIINNLFYGFRDLAVSDRFYYSLSADQRLHTVGGRGGR